MREHTRNHFATTHWTLIFTARNPSIPEAPEALAQLCQRYWYPLYAFLRRQGHEADAAQDLTQGFFAQLLEKNYLNQVDPDRGRFRTFLLASLKHFVLNERDREHAKKRGGGVRLVSFEIETAEGLYVAEPRDDATPESVFERRWAMTMLDQAMASLRAEYAQAGNEALFEQLKPYLIGEVDGHHYADLAATLGISQGALRVAVHRLRRRFAAALRALVATTVSSPSEIEAELRHLSAVVRR